MGFSKLFNCFGRSKYNYNSQILKLKSQRDELEHYREVLENRLSKFNDLCLKYMKENDRNNALFVLKRKALVSKQLNVVQEFTYKLLEVISNTETAYVQADVVKNLEIGSKLISEINRELRRKDFESFLESDRKNVDEIAETLGLVNKAYEVDDLELIQELDLLTGEINSLSFEQPLSNRTSVDNYSFDLDLTRLKTNSQATSHVNTSRESNSFKTTERSTQVQN